MINVILAEDHHIVRKGIRSLLETDINFNITGEATNGSEVLDLLGKGIPADIVLADMNMPLLNGLELTAQLKMKFPLIKVIILSALDHEKYVINAFKNGADGYLLKNVSQDELVFAIKHIFQYTQYICAELTIRLMDRLRSVPDLLMSENINNIEFSSIEIEILSLIAEGFTNQEVADKIFTSKRTIENHRQNLIDRTGSRNTVALIRYAMLNGVI